MNLREEALKVIMEEEGSVVIDNIQYTKKNVAELPPLEAFVKGDAIAEEGVIETLKKEKADLEKRLASLASKAEAKEEKKEDKPKEEKAKSEEVEKSK